VIVVRCFHDLSQAQAYRAPIDALNLACTRPDPFSTFAYFEHYLRNAQDFPDGTGLRLWLLLATRGDELVGYLALKQCTHRVLGVRASRLDLLAAHVADRPHLVARPDDVQRVSAAFYAYLLGRQSDWSLLEFEQQDAASALLPVPAQAGRGTCQIRQWPNMSIGIIEVRWEGLAGYFAALSKKARSNVSRQMRALLAAGDVQLLTSSEPQAVQELFELYRRIEPHSWKGHADVAIGRNRQSIDFCHGLIDASQPMRMVIQVLLLDGVPIAGLISGTFGKGLYAMHVVYDERHADLGPGSAILLLGMRLAIAGGCEFVNLLWGSGHYKTRWLAQMHQTQSLQIYRVGTPFYWRRVLGDVRRHLLGAPGIDGPLLFNPVRRALGQRAAVGSTRQAALLDGASERATHSPLIERIRGLRAEFLSTAQLAAAMPFATRTQV
jgi:CelD/BcsL family acetyltransferase involved in cellulose biosynthesis